MGATSAMWTRLDAACCALSEAEIEDDILNRRLPFRGYVQGRGRVSSVPLAGWTTLEPDWAIERLYGDDRKLSLMWLKAEPALVEGVEVLPPAKPKPPGRRRGAKPSKVWQQIFDHFDPVVAREGKFPSLGSAASSVEEWLEENNKTLSRRAIERGIPRHRPDWIPA
jgi:hypothetical protein